MLKKIAHLVTLLLIFAGLDNVAQTCCSGGVPLMGNIGLPPENEKTLQFNLSYDYNVLNNLKYRQSDINDNSRFRSTQSVLLQSGYAFSDGFSVNALFSYVTQFRKISQFGNENITRTAGIGDAVVLGSYTVHNMIGNNNQFQIFAGPKLPIGHTGKRNNEGRLIIADLQPGTGAFDGIGGIAFFQQIAFRPSATFYFRTIYRHAGTNASYLGDQSYTFGNEWQLFTGISDQFVIGKSIFEGSLGANYRHAGKDVINGNVLANTGGTFIYVLMSAGIYLSKNAQITAGGQLPLLNKPVGIQLVPSFRFNMGLLLTIPFKDNNSMNLNIKPL